MEDYDEQVSGNNDSGRGVCVDGVGNGAIAKGTRGVRCWPLPRVPVH